jgi:cell division protein FtsI (penicillin-binding protein 3)
MTLDLRSTPNPFVPEFDAAEHRADDRRAAEIWIEPHAEAPAPLPADDEAPAWDGPDAPRDDWAAEDPAVDADAPPEWDEPPLAALMSGQAVRPLPPRAPTTQNRAEWRLALVAAAFVLGFGAVAGRMGVVAMAEPAEPRIRMAADVTNSGRAEIVDRAGRPLAVNVPAWSAYAHPSEIDDPAAAAARLAAALEGVDEASLRGRLETGRGFTWIKRPISPEERQTIHDLGIPGVYFGSRDVRVYPAGRMAAHVLGGVRAGAEGVSGAEILGLSGAERFFDERLSDPAAGPLRLSVDLVAQAALTESLQASIDRFGAIGGSAVLMEANTGQIRAMVSLPDYDPNRPPAPNAPGVAEQKLLTNRAVSGVYEFGSVFKTFAAAAALEKRVITPDTLIETRSPMFWGRHRIKDDFRMPDQMQAADIIAKSSNVGSARMALAAGTPAMQRFLGDLGMLEPLTMEVAESRLSTPLRPQRWSDLSTITISFGYGLSVTQTHLAAAYATIVNGGLRVRPTLNPDAPPPTEADRVISPVVSGWMRDALRATITRGTARTAEAPGYEVGGKTGTANKLSRTGRGYDGSRTMTTFAGAFPMSNPAYVLVLTLDEPTNREGPQPRRTAGATAAPAAGDAIRRLAPILHLRPALPPELPGPLTVATRP